MDPSQTAVEPMQLESLVHGIQCGHCPHPYHHHSEFADAKAWFQFLQRNGPYHQRTLQAGTCCDKASEIVPQ